MLATTTSRNIRRSDLAEPESHSDPCSSAVVDTLTPEVLAGIARMVDAAPEFSERQNAALKVLLAPAGDL